MNIIKKISVYISLVLVVCSTAHSASIKIVADEAIGEPGERVPISIKIDIDFTAEEKQRDILVSLLDFNVTSPTGLGLGKFNSSNPGGFSLSEGSNSIGAGAYAFNDKASVGDTGTVAFELVFLINELIDGEDTEEITISSGSFAVKVIPIPSGVYLFSSGLIYLYSRKLKKKKA